MSPSSGKPPRRCQKKRRNKRENLSKSLGRQLEPWLLTIATGIGDGKPTTCGSAVPPAMVLNAFARCRIMRHVGACMSPALQGCPERVALSCVNTRKMSTLGHGGR